MFVVFFFKQKTAYEMRISDWSSDVCSSDLRRLDPTTNMWILAQPLMEEWMRENRGPEARLRELVTELAPRLERLPALLARIDRIVETVDAEGLKLHPDSLRSEEHTSELQSLMRISYAVFCLKKKKKTTLHVHKTH